MAVAELHKRQQVQGAPYLASALKPTKKVFASWQHTPSIENHLSQARVAVAFFLCPGLPDFGSGASSHVASQQLGGCLRRLESCVLARKSSAVEHPTTGKRFLLCGLASCLAHVALALDTFVQPNGGQALSHNLDTELYWDVWWVFEWADWLVLPSEVVCPARLFCLLVFRLGRPLGIRIRPVGPGISILEHAA